MIIVIDSLSDMNESFLVCVYRENIWRDEALRMPSACCELIKNDRKLPVETFPQHEQGPRYHLTQKTFPINQLCFVICFES